MADDVERRPMTADEIKAMRGHAVQDMIVQQAQTIATLRADLAKAVEGLERIEGQAICVGIRHNAAEADDWLVNIANDAQSILKEIRP